MDLPEAMTRIQSIVAALTYTGGASVLKAVHLADGPDSGGSDDSKPCAYCYSDGELRPYAHYGNALAIATIGLRIVTSHFTDHGSGHVKDDQRVSNAQQKSSLSSIIAKVWPATYFIDTDSAGNHSTWIKLDPSSGITGDGPKGEHTIRYTALVEVT